MALQLDLTLKIAAWYKENFRIPRSCILFFIFITGSPQASVTSQVMEVQDGDTVTTNCTVFGYPQPQVTWYINDTEVIELSPNFKAMFLHIWSKSYLCTMVIHLPKDL